MESISLNIFKELNKICPSGVHGNVDLAQISRWKIGGRADCLVRPRSKEQVASIIGFLTKEAIPYIVIGATTNILFPDGRLRVVVIQFGINLSVIRMEGDRISAEAGVWTSKLARIAAKEGLAGLEYICGIPGTLGGLIFMNGGSQRKSISDHIEKVTAIMPNGEACLFTKKECDFSYRKSVFQNSKGVIVEALLKFQGRREEISVIRRRMLNELKERKQKFPIKIPNCGSVFVSHPEVYDKWGSPGKIIESLGLKGMRIGGAQISTQHANFINNIGGATAKDVLNLIDFVRKKVVSATGCEMQTEVKFVGDITVKGNQSFKRR